MMIVFKCCIIPVAISYMLALWLFLIFSTASAKYLLVNYVASYTEYVVAAIHIVKYYIIATIWGIYCVCMYMSISLI